MDAIGPRFPPKTNHFFHGLLFLKRNIYSDAKFRDILWTDRRANKQTHTHYKRFMEAVSWKSHIQQALRKHNKCNDGAQRRIEKRSRTLSDFQLSAGVSQSREQVQLDASLSAQIALQMLSFLLHGWQSGQQHVRLFLHAVVLSQSLSPKNTLNSKNVCKTSVRLPPEGVSALVS